MKCDEKTAFPERHFALHTGETLAVRVLYPPLPEGYRGMIWWGFAQEELLRGAWADRLYSAYYIGEIDGRIAGNMACYAPSDTRDVGLVEFVGTGEAHRRKGVASALLSVLIDDFRARGGQVLYLCTTNPAAGALYEKHGFRYQVGDGMRYLAPGAEDFDRRYFGYGDAAIVREAHRGDLPRIAALYNHPEPAWFVKNYLTGSFADTRFEVHFLQLMTRIEGGNGVFLVLDAPDRRVVGAAMVERLPTYYEQHAATLSFRICPAYQRQAPELFAAMEQRAAESAIQTLRIHIADGDADQIALTASAGFSEAARFPRHFRDGESSRALIVYGKELAGAVAPIRGREAYYAGRQPWQEEGRSMEGEV